MKPYDDDETECLKQPQRNKIEQSKNVNINQYQYSAQKIYLVTQNNQNVEKFQCICMIIKVLKEMGVMGEFMKRMEGECFVTVLKIKAMLLQK